jgi:hypothetical protein
MGRHIENSCQDPNLIENKRKMIWSLFLITVILIAKLTGAFFTRTLTPDQICNLPQFTRGNPDIACNSPCFHEIHSFYLSADERSV